LSKLVEAGQMEVIVDKGLHEALMVSAVVGEGSAGSGSNEVGGKKDHAPDETSTPGSVIFGAAARDGKGGSDGVEGENAIQKTHALLDGAVPAKRETGSISSTMQGEVKGDDATIPDPKETDVAPDATGTPDSLIYKPGSSNTTTTATSTTSSSTNSKPNANEPILELENISKLTSTFGLSASEVVDLTRAVMQIKEKAKKAAKSESESGSGQ